MAIETPELDKLAKVREQSQICGEFLEWLQNKQLLLCKYVEGHSNGETKYIEVGKKPNGDIIYEAIEGHWEKTTTRRMDAKENPNYEYITFGFYPSYEGSEKLLAEFFGIDLVKIEDEKRLILEQCRKQSEIPKIVLKVKKVEPYGDNRYPCLQNAETGEFYVDVSLGREDHQPIKYSIPGAWHSLYGGEPYVSLKENIEFVLWEDNENDRKN